MITRIDTQSTSGFFVNSVFPFTMIVINNNRIIIISAKITFDASKCDMPSGNTMNGVTNNNNMVQSFTNIHIVYPSHYVFYSLGDVGKLK